MTRARRQRPLLIALYLNAALLLAALATLWTRGAPSSFLPSAFGATLAPQPIAGGANLYLMPAQFSPNQWGCYILDIDTQSLCAYKYNPTGTDSALQLVAARRITYDRKLTNFNSSKPSWMDIQKLIEQQNQGIRGATNAAGEPDQAHSNPETNTQDRH